MQIMFVTKAGIGEKLAARLFGDGVTEMQIGLDIDLASLSKLTEYGSGLIARRKDTFGAGHVVIIYGHICNIIEGKEDLDDLLGTRLAKAAMEELPELRTVLDGVRARLHYHIGERKYNLDLHLVITRLDRMLCVCLDYAEKRIEKELAVATLKELMAEMKAFVDTGSPIV